MLSIKSYIKSHKRLHAITQKIRHPLYKQPQYRLITFEEGFGLASQWARANDLRITFKKTGQLL